MRLPTRDSDSAFTAKLVLDSSAKSWP